MSNTVLFITAEHKGDEMMVAAKEAGCTVLLLTEDKRKEDGWPHDHLDEIFYMPDLAKYQDVINAVSYLCRDRHIERIFPTDEFEMEVAAMLREHLRLGGMGTTVTRNFRDKLAMRQLTRDAGMTVPEFIGVKNYDDMREFMGRVPLPWVLKPRSEAGAMGIRKIDDAEQVWRALDELGDAQSLYLVEQFVPGDVYHVDSLWVNGEVVFVSAQKYGAPPMSVYQGGGVFNSRILDRASDESKALIDLSEKVGRTLGIKNGPTHAEFIRAHADGEFYFLEVAARVGGAFIADMLEHGTGYHPWKEWARLEVALMRGEAYKLPQIRDDYAGIALSLARQEHPDMSGYTDPEIVWRAPKKYHAGLIVVSKDPARVESLLADYNRRFAEDFLAVVDPMGPQRTGIDRSAE